MMGAFGFAQPMQPRLALSQTIARATPQPVAPAAPMLTAQNFMKPPAPGGMPAAAPSSPATSIGLPGPAADATSGGGGEAGEGLGDSDFLDDLTGDGEMAEAMAGA